METSISDATYSSILEGILSGDIPVGSAISEHSLAKKFAISRTPVREAIRRLKHEGLVRQYPRCGTVVCLPTSAEVRELYEFREALECYSVRRAATVATPQDIAMLEGAVDRMNVIADELRDSGGEFLQGDMLANFFKTDAVFHERILYLSRNQRILKSVQDSRVIARIFGIPRAKHDLSVVLQAGQMHRKICECIKNQDGELASHFMSEHISMSCKQTLDYYEKMEQQGLVVSSTALDVRVGLSRSRLLND